MSLLLLDVSAGGVVVASSGTSAALLATTPALGDLALLWDASRGSADIALLGSDLRADGGLVTAVLLSLMLDRRALDDDVPPSGDATDRRGWWADQFLPDDGDRYGSRLWLLERSKATSQVAIAARAYIAEALQWMIDDKVVSSADITVELARDRLLYRVEFVRPRKDPVAFRFAHTWDAMIGAPLS